MRYVRRPGSSQISPAREIELRRYDRTMDDALSAKVALRRGWTTGTCAAAAAAAAYRALLCGAFPDAVTVALPRGGTATLPIASRRCDHASATAGVIKDAGDDPDVTHGAEILATVTPAPRWIGGVAFAAGPGVGTVTLPGLPLAGGRAGDQSGPAGDDPRRHRERRRDLRRRRRRQSSPSPFPAARRWLKRPSTAGWESSAGCRSWEPPASSCRSPAPPGFTRSTAAIDVARAAGFAHVAAATGSTSEAAVKRLYDLPGRGADRHGRLRRRHAQVPAPPSGARG